MTSHFAEIKSGHSTYIICWIIPHFNLRHRYRVLSITLIWFEIISRNLVQIKYDQTLIVNCYSFYSFFSVLCHFVILYMVSIEIVSFCRIISLWNFQYRNHVHSITLMSFQIISQNLVQYKAWLDDVQRLRTVTSLDVSAVAGHHAMPAALLFINSKSVSRWRWGRRYRCRVVRVCEKCSKVRS